MVTDGRFAETKDLIAGYWLWQELTSLQDAIDWARKAPTDGNAEFNLELHQTVLRAPRISAKVAAPEQIAQERAWRDEQAKNAPKATAWSAQTPPSAGWRRPGFVGR